MSDTVAGAERVVEVEEVPLEGTGSVAAVVYLNRPETLNAINSAVARELDAALRAADADDRVAAILITGRGRAFSAGGDLKGYLTMQQDPIAFTSFVDELLRVFGQIHYLRKPVVALVNGDTVAGGLELLVACDFAYAAKSARIGDGHLRYGQMGGAGSLSHLPRLIGPARARELFFSARLLSADEALDWGLVNRVVDDDALLDAGLEFARGVAQFSPAGIANAKYAMNAGWADGTGEGEALRLERERACLYCLTLPDSREGLLAFAEKRQPRFPGRP
jgi:enoyl-CoA hydratase/carnithine racemase